MNRVPSNDELRLRSDARSIIDAALGAVDPEPLVQRRLEESPLDLSKRGRLLVVATGKAARGMARGAVAALGGPVDSGVILVPGSAPESPVSGFREFRCGHPIPDPAGVEAAVHARRMLNDAGQDDHVLALISGGTSSCLTLPAAGVALDDVARITDGLMRSGAAIDELNVVRKHLDQVKGGRLAQAAAPARVTALVISDVPGDRLDIIGSGPFTPDPSTFAGAIEILRSRGLWASAPPGIRIHLEAGANGATADTPGSDDPVFDRVDVELLATVSTALDAAARKAEGLGYRSEILTSTQAGEAREVGEMLARRAIEMAEGDSGPVCLLLGGETAVTVVGDGVGGRNQEVALGAALGLAGRSGVLVASVGTDGIDGPTDAAGAVATGTTVGRAEAAGMGVADGLGRNDAYRVLDAIGDLVVTGPTGTNVADVLMVLVK